MDENDLVVFDLRNGRVGGLTFCGIVKNWFPPEQSFMIDNELSTAVDQWKNLPEAVRRRMRFVWGHNFSLFRQRVGLERPLRIVCLIRHPLLKVSGMSVRTPEELASLHAFSIENELERYKQEGGILPSHSVEAFLDSHFVLGVTELMEDSLALLHAKLDIKTPLTPWQRSGSLANICDNIYSHGLVGSYILSSNYRREMTYYNNARRRLTKELRSLATRSLSDLARYKIECAKRDVTMAKWNTAYPGVFEPPPPPSWRMRLRPLRPWRSPPPSAIHLNADRWTIVLGAGQANFGGENGSLPTFYDIVAPLVTFHLHHIRVASAPNLLRIELDLPTVDSIGRWIYAMMGDHLFFQVEVGREACTHAMEIPLGLEVKNITLFINQYQENKGRRLYARIRGLQALRVPLDGCS